MGGWSGAKAIETVYRGYRMRSRLEARWATFLDAIDARWQYEAEGFDLDGVRYLPDFWIADMGLWIEVKPRRPDEREKEKAGRLAVQAGHPVLVVCGVPSADPGLTEDEQGYFFRAAEDGTYSVESDYRFSQCPDCGGLGVSKGGYPFMLDCECYAARKAWVDEQNVSLAETRESAVPMIVWAAIDFLARRDAAWGYGAPTLVAAVDAARQARFGTFGR